MGCWILAWSLGFQVLAWILVEKEASGALHISTVSSIAMDFYQSCGPGYGDEGRDAVGQFYLSYKNNSSKGDNELTLI